MPKRTKKEALERLGEARMHSGRAPLKGRAKVVHDLAYMGAAGLIMLDPLNRLADERIVLPVDMVCIPAYQAYMIQGSPSLQIYVRAGETIIPTGGNVKDVEEALISDTGLEMQNDSVDSQLRKHKVSAYQKRYKKAFKQLAPNYKGKNGKWRKNGFRRCVRAAHAKARQDKK